MKARQHKLAAKDALKGNWGIAIGVFFIYFILSGIVGAIPDDYYWLYVLGFVFFSAPLSVGYSWFYLELKRGTNPNLEKLFSGFKDNYVRNLLSSVLVTIFTFLWSLLLIIPGIIKGLSYSMTFYILRDNPQMSALEAITESRRLMDGKKKNLFFLCLSFIGWYLIPVAFFIVATISLIIGFIDGVANPFGMVMLGIGSLIVGGLVMFGVSIYVTPYYMTSIAAFYDNFVKPTIQESKQEVEELNPPVE
ncbi:DUF975 family protein [Bacillus massiliigorillae]|uniref:DUF975 family protein n=1 Tax=Bacillus massiliigorillae TaxID=1243664 RepID=UPI0003AB295C|nr:DUF975 family protein [Bacillus massiliigorillae]